MASIPHAQRFFRCMITMKVVFCILLSLSTTRAFQLSFSKTHHSRTKLHDATGGWGVGQSREMGEIEKAGGKRRSFEKYDAQEQGMFLRQVQEDRKAMMEQTKKELLECAAFAGIEFNDPATDKFSVDLFMDDEDDLDLRVDFDDPITSCEFDEDATITRLDEDTGALEI